MTPSEINIVKSLIALAWADGRMEDSEASVVEGLLVGFDASEAEEAELLAWARTPRTLDEDVPAARLSEEDKELLLSNAALLTLADGRQTAGELEVLNQLTKILGFEYFHAQKIIGDARDGALRLRSEVLKP